MREILSRAVMGAIVIASGAILLIDCGSKHSTDDGCYTLTIDINGSGTVQIEPEADCYHTGTLITLTALPEEGNTFNRWSGDVVRYSNPYQLSLIRNTSLIANFASLYTISINLEPAEAGTVFVDPDQEYYETGDSVGLWAVPDSGFVFSDWIINEDTSDTNPIFFIIELENIMATARFAGVR